jgi:hypothetical protein
VSGSAWTVGRTIAPGFGPDIQCSPRPSRLRLPGWSMAGPSSKAEAATRQQSRVVEFEGTLLNQPLMGSYSNVDDTVLSVPGAPYGGVALRSFDPKTQQWSIWWLDSRTPSEPLDPPMIGGFHSGVGTFYGDDTVNGKRVRARFIWSNITPTSCHWEQADSPDEGKTWETNWVQDITRVR